ncbi:substrate-binding domain-containing protein [Paracoccus spongiarum]|uniref:Substrate-binding domain-containing protein n=1 Tax=Paracoccus spongiarum TaxID=3064387 RepID=A0ABT9JCB6_9RHOB|nr:substrate-binding domain-containing protein [Paracoccus sp. 2205BS29-5]MDP5307443.1 substrate-binding domain-containing protein [Paracoccus sp. 2205BS29-5]
MKASFVAATVAALTAAAAQAENIGVSMQSFDNNFQTLLRLGLEKRAGETEGVTLQVEDAQADVAKQLNQVNNFIAAGVDAIIVTLADTSSAPALTAAAEGAGIPLVYLNLEPANLASLPNTQVYVGSRETDSGRLGGEAGCALLSAAGKAGDGQVYILMGDLVHDAARARTAAVKEALATGDCAGTTVADEQSAGWTRNMALDLTTNWLTAGNPIDAIFANNDEMAIGAIHALKSAGTDMDEVVVVGIDATQDGLAAMKAGDLDVTVFQNAGGQAASALDAAVALARGEAVEKEVMVPFELVTPENMADFAAMN